MNPTDGSWFAEQLDAIEELAAGRYRDTVSRDTFVQRLEAFAGAVADRPGVIGCVVGQDGVLIAGAGAMPDPDTLAAVSHLWTLTANEGGRQLELGPMRQLVTVTDGYKIAVLQAGGLTVAVLADALADLASALHTG